VRGPRRLVGCGRNVEARKRRLLGWFGAFALAAGCAQGSIDAGPGLDSLPGEAGVVGLDAGGFDAGDSDPPLGSDSGSIQTAFDSGTGSGTDDSGSVEDTGTAGDDDAGSDAGGATDSGGIEQDSGTTVIDSGTTEVDSGTTEVDSGTTEVDSGTTGMDSGKSAVDSGHEVDSGGTDGGGGTDAGPVIPATCGLADNAVGCCIGNELYYCKAGTSTITATACASGKVCGWDSAKSYYDCVSPPATSSASYPIACP
jgi:hypothetical protein